MATQPRALVQLATKAEDVASGLRVFRDSLPRSTTIVTAIIGELFTISSLLQRIDRAHHDARYEPSFYRIEDDMATGVPSLERTLQDCLDMFGRSARHSYRRVWEDLEHRMQRREGSHLFDRLTSYRDFFDAQLDVVTGEHPTVSREVRQEVVSLAERQGVVAVQHIDEILPSPGEAI